MKIKKVFLIGCLIIASVFSGFALDLLGSKTKVYSAENDVSFSTVIGVNTSPFESYNNLFDGRKTSSNFTKWFVSMDRNPFVVFKASENIVLTGYTFTSGNDNATVEVANGRNPKSWKVYASSDYSESTNNGTWQVLQTVTNNQTMNEDVNFKDYEFYLSENTGIFKYYKFEFTESQNGSAMQLCELGLKYTKASEVSTQIVGDLKVTYGKKDVDYSFNTENKTLTILTSTRLQIENVTPTTATDNKIVINGGVNAHVLLAGVNIDLYSTYYQTPFLIQDNSTGNVRITLKSQTTNYLYGGNYSAGIQKCGIGDDVGTLTIDGKGTLYAKSNREGAGIGGSMASPKVRNIIIEDGNVYAESGSYGAGIGAGTGDSSEPNAVTAKNIYIRGGTVTVKSGFRGSGIGAGLFNTASNIYISGGSVKTILGSECKPFGSASTEIIPTDENGNNVYLLKIENPNNQSVTINGKVYAPSNHSAFDDTNLYAYVSGAESTVKVGESVLTYHFSQNAFQKCEASSNFATDSTGHWYSCVVSTCDEKFSFSSHNYSVAQHDSNGHWTACLVEGCEYTQNYSVHSYQNYVADNCKVSDMTCTEQAVYYKSCSCGQQSTDTFSYGTPSHSFANVQHDDFKVSDMTCVEPAKYYKSCTVCRQASTDIFEVGNPSHSFTNVVDDDYKVSDATCTSPAIYKKSCSVCHIQGTETFESGNSLGHSLGTNGVCSTCNRLIGTIFGDFGVIGGTSGVDYKFENNKLSILTDTPIRITQKDPEKPTTNTIYVANGVNANITLAGVYIDKSLSSYINDNTTMGECAFEIAENSIGSVTIMLEANTTNILKSGRGYAGLQKNGENGYLIINGKGKLVAMGGQGGAGIGSGSQKKVASNIIILDGVITALGSRFTNGSYAMEGTKFEAASGIGSGCNKVTVEGLTIAGNILIAGGTVTADGFSSSAIGGTYKDIYNNIKIIGGSVKLSHYDYYSTSYLTGGKNLILPKNREGQDVYLLTIENPNSEVVAIDGRIYELNNHLAENGTDTNLYAYVTGETHIVQVGSTAYTYTFSNNTFIKSETPAQTQNVKSLFISAKNQGEQAIENTDYTYDGNVLKIISSKEMVIESRLKNITDVIVIGKDVDANITLSGVDIDKSASETGCAFMIEEDSSADVVVTIKNGTVNILRSGSSANAIMRKGHTGSFTINGGGSLVLDSGSYAIDGGYTSENSSDIVINGGSINIVSANHFGKEDKLVVPVNSAGENVYLMTIKNISRKTIVIDDINISNDYCATFEDSSYYSYLLGTDHTIEIGTDQKLYHFENNNFLLCAQSEFVTHDDSGHWFRCFHLGCNVKYSFEAHNYSQTVVANEFLKTPADCLNDATYYYSCSCGHKTPDEDRWFSDSSSALDHSYTKTDGSTNYGSNDEFHWNVCIRCGHIHSYSYYSHNFDKECGNCTCTDCGKVVFKQHNVVKESYYNYSFDANQHWYPCRNTDCDYKDELANHTFGYTMSSERDKHVKRCTECHYMQEGSLEECNYIIKERDERKHVYRCEKCNRYDSFDYHSYDDNCDTTCNVCNEEREPIHYYDNGCDTTCNSCGATRTTTHIYSNDCDTTCNECGAIRTVTHFYDDDCDEYCNECNNKRTVEHNYSSGWKFDAWYHYHECSNCNHIGDVANHSYTNNSDLTCNICSYVRPTPITNVNLLLTNYRYGMDLSWGTQVYSRTYGIEVEYFCFGLDERLIKLEEDFENYIIGNGLFLEDNKNYYALIGFESTDEYDVSSIIADNIKLSVNGKIIKSKKILITTRDGANCVWAGFVLPKLVEEEFNEINDSFNFKLTGYEQGEKIGDIVVETTKKVDTINFDSQSDYGENYFITTSVYTEDAFSCMVDGNKTFENNKIYYLVVYFNTKLDYHFGYDFDFESIMLEGFGLYYNYDVYYNDFVMLFRLHELGATIIDNLEFTYSGYAVDQKITDISVDYDNTEGIEKADSYYDGWYNYCIVTNIDGYLSNDYSSSKYSYVEYCDNGKFMPNMDYYLVVNIYPLENYSLENFEQANVTFNGEASTSIVLYDAEYALVVYKLPKLTQTSTATFIEEFSLSISGYKEGNFVTSLQFELDSENIEQIAFGSDYSEHSSVTMHIYDSSTSASFVSGSNSTTKFMQNRKYVLNFYIRAKEGYSFYGLTQNDVTISTSNRIDEFVVSAGGGFVIIEITLPFIQDWHEHEFGEVVTTLALKTPADCLNDAVYYKSCTCGELDSTTFTDADSKLGHNMSEDWYCNESGHYHRCLRDNCSYKDSTVAHTCDRETATEINPILCTVCEYIVSPILNHSHTLTKVAKNLGTCLVNGTKEYYSCEGCGKKFSDENGNDEIANFDTWVVVAGSHSYSTWVEEVSATCLENGVKAHKQCEHCNKYFDNSDAEILNISIPKYSHKLDNLVSQVRATCSSMGTKEHQHCSLCNKNFDLFGNELTDLSTPIDPNGHSVSVVKGIAPTCTEKGRLSHFKCTICEKLFDKTYTEITETEIAELGHSFTDWIDKVDATHLASGTIAHKDCRNCNKHFDENDNEIADISIPFIPSGISAGAVVGIVLASVVVASVSAFSIFWFAIKKKNFSMLISSIKRRIKK